MRCQIDAVRSVEKHLSYSPAGRLGHLAVHGSETTKEAALPPECLVDKLVNDNQIARNDPLLKRFYRSAAYDRMDAEFLQSEDIGCKRHLAWGEFVSVAVTASVMKEPVVSPASV